MGHPVPQPPGDCPDSVTGECRPCVVPSPSSSPSCWSAVIAAPVEAATVHRVFSASVGTNGRERHGQHHGVHGRRRDRSTYALKGLRKGRDATGSRSAGAAAATSAPSSPGSPASRSSSTGHRSPDARPDRRHHEESRSGRPTGRTGWRSGSSPARRSAAGTSTSLARRASGCPTQGVLNSRIDLPVVRAPERLPVLQRGDVHVARSTSRPSRRPGRRSSSPTPGRACSCRSSSSGSRTRAST